MGQMRNGHLHKEYGKQSEVESDPKLTMEASRWTSSKLQTIQVHAALLVLQLGSAGAQVISLVALTTGLSQFVYSLYRNGIALVLIVPFAYAVEKKHRPPMTRKLLFKLFLVGQVTGIVGYSQLVYLTGLIYTSATFAAIMQSSIPIFTLILALILGLETVRFRRVDGKAKVLGTVLCVAGAVLMSAWKGPAIIEGWYIKEEHPEDEGLKVKAILGQMVGSHALRLGIDTWQLGSICLLSNCVSWAAYFIMLAPILRVCPTPLTLTAYMYVVGILQVGFLMLVFTGGKISWSLSWGPQVVSVLYAGIVSSGINLSLQSWAIQKGGPVLVSLYTPVQTIMVAIFSVVLLGESCYLGSIIGGVGTVAGLYVVTWGQVQQQRLDALEEVQAYGDVESEPDDPQTAFFSSSSDLTKGLLPEGDYSDEEQKQEQSSGAIDIPSLKRRPSFYEELSGSFSLHNLH